MGSEFTSSSSDESSMTLVEERKSLEVIDISLDKSFKEMPIKYKSPQITPDNSDNEEEGKKESNYVYRVLLVDDNYFNIDVLK